ncbi:hypothetical protein LWI29_028599 [Acer saccharum]|uniref:MLO-like protein n=1 Tax=Acer saccharum TaxID=4024 RepID=A0AA39TA75_ACESA|nr:hypothetical protein LWI29_028599 [Acer saccharum]
MVEKQAHEGRSFAETPTWAVATVITIMVLLGFFFHECLKKFGKGRESFASRESLEQLHRFIFVLGVTHVSYSFIAIALAMIKLCFSRQFWSSINRADYMALRLGFLTNHQLPLTYDFHKYMLRSMEEEFRDIVGISVPLWIYAIVCIILDFHGTNIYLWLSFLPAILILLIGTKLHRVVVKLAVEIMDRCPWMENHKFNLRDDLFWFGKPKLLLHLIQLISFQNAFEMATFLWSLWEIKEPSCFMENRSFVVIRLTFGVTSQFWCSFITFPLYVIITQMGSRLKRSVVSQNVRTSLSHWKRRVRAKKSIPGGLLSAASTTSLESMEDDVNQFDNFASSSNEGSSSMGFKDMSVMHRDTSGLDGPNMFDSSPEEELEASMCLDTLHEDNDNDNHNRGH